MNNLRRKLWLKLVSLAVAGVFLFFETGIPLAQAEPEGPSGDYDGNYAPVTVMPAAPVVNFMPVQEAVVVESSIAPAPAALSSDTTSSSGSTTDGYTGSSGNSSGYGWSVAGGWTYNGAPSAGPDAAPAAPAAAPAAAPVSAPGGTTTYFHDDNGNVVATLVQNGNTGVATHAYVTYADGSTRFISYDASGNVTYTSDEYPTNSGGSLAGTSVINQYINDGRYSGSYITIFNNRNGTARKTAVTIENGHETRPSSTVTLPPAPTATPAPKPAPAPDDPHPSLPTEPSCRGNSSRLYSVRPYRSRILF